MGSVCVLGQDPEARAFVRGALRLAGVRFDDQETGPSARVVFCGTLAEQADAPSGSRAWAKGISAILSECGRRPLLILNPRLFLTMPEEQIDRLCRFAGVPTLWRVPANRVALEALLAPYRFGAEPLSPPGTSDDHATRALQIALARESTRRTGEPQIRELLALAAATFDT